ncbi:MAG TPA: energy transducer TonB [Rudaea sp.]
MDKVPQIRARLEQEVRKWQFLPGLIDGKPEETKTGLYLRTTLTPTNNDTFDVRIDHAGVGPTETRMTPPRYPADAIRHRKTGQVILAVAYDAEGHVVSVQPADDSPKVDPLLTEASEKAARKWQFQPELVGGHPLAGRALIPFCYTLNILPSGRKEGNCNWKRPGSNETLRDGETFALSPAAKLLTDVAGRTL